MSGGSLPLIPILAGILTVAAFPELLTSSTDSRSTSKRSSSPSSDGEKKQREKRRRSPSGLLCDVWTVVSSVVVVAAWTVNDLHFDGRDQLLNEVSSADRVRDGNAADNSSSPTVDAVSDAIKDQCGMASLILGTAMVLEFFQVVANRAARRRFEDGFDASVRQQQHTIYTLFGWHDSVCMLVVYAILFVVYITMSYDKTGEATGLIFAEPVVAAVGVYRPISTIRYIEWAIASPLLMSLVGRSLPRLGVDTASVSETLRPALVVCTAYVFVAWLALTVINPIWRWVMISVCFVGYALSVMDQLTAWRCNLDKSAACYRASDILLKVQIIIYGMYGAILLLAMFGILDPISEQAALTFADSTIKLACSASLASMRHADSLAEAKSSRSKADSIAEDLKRMIQGANAPIFAVDCDMKVTIWNNKLEKLTGAFPCDVIGRPVEELLSKECREEVRAMLNARKRGIQGAEQFHCDFRIAPSTSSEERSHDEDIEQLVSLKMTATARHDTEGCIVGIVGIGQDLTEVTRIKVIEEKQSQFMAVVSHELKSPLHGIIGLAESLSRSEKMDHRKDQLKMVKSCATRLLDLVSNIMQMKRLQRDMEDGIGKGGATAATIAGGKEKLREDPVDIPSIISEVCTLVENATDKSNRPILNPRVQFYNNVESGRKAQRRLPIIEGDAYKITQVFYNLLTNACKFCTSGSIIVDASVSSSKDMLEVSITDTGIGISPENVKRIFEPFEQESNSSKRSFGGIGLGLAISKEVVQLHGGTISVQSTPGKGSKFIVSLPVTAEAVELALALGEEEHDDSQPMATSGFARPRSSSTLARRESDLSSKAVSRLGDDETIVILSVDDDIVNQEVIKTALSDRYEIHVAMNGFDALEFFSTRSKLPDLVLLDVMMPGMDGFDVLRTIRDEKNILPTTLPVIMLSAMEPVDKAVLQSLKSGANDYVSKPFDPDILKARVNTAVEIKRLRQIENESFHHSRLLHDILPTHIVERLVLGEKCISERHDSVCMLFADIVGWTTMSESVPTHQLVDLLNSLFSAFDELTEKHGVFKAETIGDAYIVAAGHEGQAGPSDATLRVVEYGLNMLEKVKSIRPPRGMQLQIRVGIHTGSAYSGVVGSKVPKYTFFGDTVNTAARMETMGLPGCVNMSRSCQESLAKEIAACRSGCLLEDWLNSIGASLVQRDPVEVKGKGVMDMFIICPRGISPRLARNLSLQISRHSSESIDAIQYKQESHLISSENEGLPSSETKLLLELDALKQQRDMLQVSERSAWSEVESLQQSLASLNTKLTESTSTAPSFASAAPSPQDVSTNHQVEELKLQLLVTTKSLMRARQTLLDKEAEIDGLELELERVKAKLERRSSLEGHGMNLDKAPTQGRRGSFMARTHSLLGSTATPSDFPLGMASMSSPSSRRLSSMSIREFDEVGSDVDEMTPNTNSLST